MPAGTTTTPACRSAVASCCRSCAHHPRSRSGVGVKFATGVDTEYSRRSVARVGGEIAYLVDAGLSPLAAIQAATIGGAELLGIAPGPEAWNRVWRPT